MNIERLTILAEWLEAGAPPRDGVEGFDTRYFGSAFGYGEPKVCIAGAAAAFFGDRAVMAEECRTKSKTSIAGALLGIEDERVQNRLFIFGVASLTPMKGEDVAREMAARTLRHLIATGEVVWDLGVVSLPEVEA